MASNENKKYFFVIQDTANRFSLNFGLLRYNPKNPRILFSTNKDSAGNLMCNFIPVLLGDSDDMHANLNIHCEAKKLAISSSEGLSLTKQPLTSEQILVGVTMNNYWKITDPVITLTNVSMDGGFYVSAHFKMICSPCKSLDGLVTASVSLSILDRCNPFSLSLNKCGADHTLVCTAGLSLFVSNKLTATNLGEA